LLDCRTTCIHAIHVTDEEVAAIARQAAIVCACPTTERNLGDGIVPADKFFAGDVAVALGSDSHAQIDLLEDARALEYHLRLQHLRRAVLAPESTTDEPHNTSALARRLFACASESGARSLHAAGDARQGLTGQLAPNSFADFFTVALDDPSIAGARAEDLLPLVVFTLARSAIRDVFVGGRAVVREGRHTTQESIIARFTALQRYG